MFDKKDTILRTNNNYEFLSQLSGLKIPKGREKERKMSKLTELERDLEDIIKVEESDRLNQDEIIDTPHL